MENFKQYLKQEYLNRVAKNSSYSLRAYAQQLGMNHATLSGLLNGKRKITKSTVMALSKSLGLSPNEVRRFVEAENETSNESEAFFLLQNDVFALISEWYFDAILELSIIPNINLNPKTISVAIDIPILQATFALEILERLELLKKDEKGRYKIAHLNSTNILDESITTSARKKYQRSILEKSLEALEAVDYQDRDHTSTTMAISYEDLPSAKKLIKKFRHDLNAYMQRDVSKFDRVYQLQISFFPLSNTNDKGVSYEN